MAAARRITAQLSTVDPVRDPLGCGVALSYTPTSRNTRDLERVEDFADLGPEHTLESANGLAILLRVLRAARLAAPRPPESWLGEPERAVAVLERAIGQSFAIEGSTRVRLRFVAWTEDETLDIDAVTDVIDDGTAFLVHRLGHRPLVRVPRKDVVRHELRREAWFEIRGIERA